MSLLMVHLAEEDRDMLYMHCLCLYWHVAICFLCLYLMVQDGRASCCTFIVFVLPACDYFCSVPLPHGAIFGRQWVTATLSDHTFLQFCTMTFGYDNYCHIHLQFCTVTCD